MRRNPPDVHVPFGGYAHTIRVPAQKDLVFVSGQVGAGRDGAVPTTIRGQARQAVRNLQACLAAEDLSVSDVVRLTVYLTNADYMDAMREERRAVFGDGPMPTSTLLIVGGLALPELMVEIDAIAAGDRSR